jgi:hypothetical protein
LDGRELLEKPRMWVMWNWTRERSVEEKELGFEVVDGGSRGFHEIIKNFFEGSSLSGGGGSHEHCVINKLVMSQGIPHVMKREVVDLAICHHLL